MTPSAAAAPARRLSRSSSAPRCTAPPAAATAAAAASERASPTTWWPAPMSSGTTAEPMKPDAPVTAAPIDAVAAALEAAGALFQERREFARQRQTIIAANAELQERELIKLATLAAAIADTLRRRGVPDPAASLAAEAGIAVFRVAFQRWVDADNELGWSELVRSSLAELKVLVAS